MDYTTAVVTFALNLSHSMFPQANLDSQVTKTAMAIVQVTNDNSEAETLIKIAAMESGFSDDVRTCKITGDHAKDERPGSMGDARGTFQIHRSWLVQIGESNRVKFLCTDLVESARIALETINTSKEFCKKAGMKGADLLGVYVSGRCFKGNSVAKSHYGDGKKIIELMLIPTIKYKDHYGICFSEKDNVSGWYDE